MRRCAALLPLILLAGCDKPAPEPARPAPAASKAPPADQQAFLALTQTGGTAGDFCPKFKTYNGFENWQARVYALNVSSLDGTADLEITIGQSVRLEALVGKGDAAYAKVMALTYGQAVTVSGQLQHSNNDAECLYYRGPFGFRLTNLISGG